MPTDFSGLPPAFLAAAFVVTLFAGFVKGAVGFAMPMIMISALSSFLPAPVALAALIVPTVLTNIAQACRGGVGAAVESIVTYKRLIGSVVLFIFLSAPLVAVLPDAALYLLLGGPILLFTVTQLLGKQLILPAHRRHRAEVMMGALGGFFGGVSGVWGPPVIAYLLSFNTEKTEALRVQGVVFLLGGVMLLVSHVGSGVLNAQTAPLSVAMVVPAGLGMWLGFKVHDRLDAARFRKATLFVLSLAAANLIRKGLMG
ncbi:sulfite exporter TauE/SafE family protein [Actibacterium sp. MT2.3-13A]|uniref:sulfite exporter TauE/SafE family protein n=1 Tax=Actibacterium sp. MT2.3-13A TaxID=2828332 RepID=UPI001BAE1F64|nr:sulfite exporter TauE/SafE family protein [Actibacterium sp. MT2.3-13A]